MDALDLVAWLLIGLAVLNVASTSVLVLAAVRHHWAALEERATVAVILAIIAVGVALLSLSRLRVLELAAGLPAVILVVGLVLVSVPSLVWLVAFLTGRFDEAETDEP